MGNNRERMKVSYKENIDRDTKEIKILKRERRKGKTGFKVIYIYIWKSCGTGRSLERPLNMIL
jgi:hypothetical protein